MAQNTGEQMDSPHTGEQALLSAVLIVQPDRDVVLPAHLGRAFQAWLLRRMGECGGEAATLAAGLHDGSRLRPYTVSGLMGPAQDTGATMRVPGGKPAHIHITSYAPALSRVLAGTVLPGATHVDLEKPSASLRIVRVATTPAEHVLAERADYASLRAGTLRAAHLRGGRPSDVVDMRFASPTLFKSKGLYLPAPLPYLVFGGLARRWNEHAPVKSPAEMERFVEENVSLAAYRLATLPVSYHTDGSPGEREGFVGQCRFVLKSKDSEMVRWIHVLSDFAKYAGVGMWTTHGMGQAVAMR